MDSPPVPVPSVKSPPWIMKLIFFFEKNRVFFVE